MVLYMAPVAEMQEMMRNPDPERAKAGTKAWMDWGNKHQKDLVDMGAPLGKSKRVTSAGAADVSNDIGGYSIVQANSADDAAGMFDKSHPHLQMSKNATIEIIEIMPMPGM
jgi:hypothetical protein